MYIFLYVLLFCTYPYVHTYPTIISVSLQLPLIICIIPYVLCERCRCFGNTAMTESMPWAATVLVALKADSCATDALSTACILLHKHFIDKASTRQAS